MAAPRSLARLRSLLTVRPVSNMFVLPELKRERKGNRSTNVPSFVWMNRRNASLLLSCLLANVGPG